MRIVAAILISCLFLNGHSQKGHPFRLFTFATMNTDNFPKQRTVVLRNSNEDLRLTFFTDIRSLKISQINRNKKVSALFYNQEKRLQLTITGEAFLEKDKNTLEQVWKKLRTASRKDYSTHLPPGSLIQEPNSVEFLNPENNFGIVHIVPQKIEYLKLNQPQHLRIQFKSTKGGWEGQFLVP